MSKVISLSNVVKMVSVCRLAGILQKKYHHGYICLQLFI